MATLAEKFGTCQWLVARVVTTLRKGIAMHDHPPVQIVQPPSTTMSRRAALGGLAAAGVVATLGARVASASVSKPSLTSSDSPTTRGGLMSQSTPSANAPLSVVLVHGAFADAGTWAGVVQRLQAAGLHVVATANPLRGLSEDSAYLASLVSQIPGPVLLCGHSYAGCVIGEAAAELKNVVGLVFVSAVLLDAGESQMSILAEFPKSAPLFGPSLRPMPYPLGNGQLGTEFLVDAEMFPEIFGADLEPATTAALSVSQRPLAEAASTEKATAAAWKTLPSWTVYGAKDMALGAEALGAMAKRANSTITEIDGASHLALVSQSAAVTDVILSAVKAVS
jgi:pimeloyl-ACP methyl ester carboxylesterase